jgi:hypothetical protein
MPDAAQWLPTACFVAAYLFGGFFTLREAIDNLRLRRFEIDTLMLVAAAGAAALGAWAKARCCSSSSVSVTRSSIMRWVAPEGHRGAGQARAGDRDRSAGRPEKRDTRRTAGDRRCRDR